MLVIYPLVGVDASFRPDGFVVFAGSYAASTEIPSIHAYLTVQRADLLATGISRPDGTRLRFVEDRTFNSPLTAAGVILGRTANGRMEWKNPT